LGVAALLAIAALGAAPASGPLWLARLPLFGPTLGYGPRPIPALVFVSRDPVPGIGESSPGSARSAEPSSRTAV
jgi:hypothetical protein